MLSSLDVDLLLAGPCGVFKRLTDFVTFQIRIFRQDFLLRGSAGRLTDGLEAGISELTPTAHPARVGAPCSPGLFSASTWWAETSPYGFSTFTLTRTNGTLPWDESC